MPAALNDDELLSEVVDFQTRFEELTGRDRAMWVSRIRRDVISETAVVVQPTSLNINVTEGRAWNMEGGTMVQLLLRGQAVAQPSSFTAVYDESGQLVSTQQILLREVGSEHQGRLTLWSDGAERLDMIVHESGATMPYESWHEAGSSNVDDSQVQPLGWSFKKFRQCLNRMGVANWVVTAISIVCAVACALTFGTGCIICIAGVASIHSTILFYCARTATT